MPDFPPAGLGVLPIIDGISTTSCVFGWNGKEEMGQIEGNFIKRLPHLLVLIVRNPSRKGIVR